MREIMKDKVSEVSQVIFNDAYPGSTIVDFSVETNGNSTATTTQKLSNTLATVDAVGDNSVDPSEDSKSMTGGLCSYFTTLFFCSFVL